MKIVLFTAIIASSYLYTDAAITWSDCSTGTNNAVTVYNIDLSPPTVIFPGPLTVSLNLTINRQIDHIFVDVELIKKTGFGNTRIPCIAGTNVGSCLNIDGCHIIDDILNGSTPVSIAFGQQVQAALVEATGHKPQCPIPVESVVFTQKHFTLDAIPSNVLSSIADGNYHIKIMLKDDPTSSENVGCLTIDVGIKNGNHHGFLFN